MRLPPPPRPPNLERMGRAAREASGEERPRVPGEEKPGREKGGGGDEGVKLRLAIGRTGFGLELGAPVRMACLRVTDLSVALPGARFPLDVTGGVARFRHRRGSLQRIVLELSARPLEAWAATRLRGLLSPQAPEVWVAPRRNGVTMGVTAPSDVLDPKAVPRALAFEIALIPEAEHLRFVVSHARGIGLPSPPTALAILAVQALLGGIAQRRGALFVANDVPLRVARAIFPEAGARVPSVDDVRWAAAAAHDDTWILHGWVGAPPPDTSKAALSALEAAKLLVDADDARVAGDLETARALDVAALERAPRHPEICRRIAEIDRLVGGRAEAALALLLDAGRELAASDGVLVADLWGERGDRVAAAAAYARAGDAEPVPALAALAFGRAAEVLDDGGDAAGGAERGPHLVEASRWLDEALARAPRMAHLRWARVERRLALGQLDEALADVQHLEAQARGARAKGAIWQRAGEAWRNAGYVAHAAGLYERALRFVPDTPAALEGLGSALLATAGSPGKREALRTRGVQLLSRAVEIAGRRGELTAGLELTLARALAEHLNDLPAAIARVRSLTQADVVSSMLACGLEGRWRAALGDIAGASLAFARLRDLAASQAEGGGALARGPIIELLLEGGALERDVNHDRAAAQRYFAVVLRLDPHHPIALREHRALGVPKPPPSSPSSSRPSSLPAMQPMALPPAPPSSESLLDSDESQAASRVEELSRRLQLDPSNDALVDELATLLQSLGRSHELLALLSARLEEATPERRAQLLPRTREVLTRMADHARAAGHEVEAALFRDYLASLES